MLADRHGRDAQRLHALARVLATLDPRAPLARGFVLVKDSDGALVRSRKIAATLPAMTVEFADGTMDVAPLEPGGASPPRKPARAVRPNPAQSGQEDLFG